MLPGMSPERAPAASVLASLIASLPFSGPALAHGSPGERASEPAGAGAAAVVAAPVERGPFLSMELGGTRLEASLLAAARFEDAGSFAVDAAGTSLSNATIYNQVRVGARFDSKMAWIPLLALFEYEHDLVTGHVYGRTELEGVGMPGSEAATHALRKLWGRVSLGPYLHLGGGFMTSHFGMGLVANDGAHGWVPGSARFLEPTGGDRVLRGFLATGPLGDAKLFASLAIDEVVDDDALFPGDGARQVVAAFIVGRNQPRWAGIYGVKRTQTSAAGRRTEVGVLDLAGSARFELGEDLGSLTLEAELVKIVGTTELAGSADFPVHDVDQTGAAARVGWDLGDLGAALELVYASGDRNLDDGVQGAFKADPRYSAGLVLFQHVLAGQTGRAQLAASDPELVGVPPDDVDRFATRGSISGAVCLAPRAFVRPLSWLELYGGPLFAFSTAALVDPFNTRIAGGSPRNALDGRPGGYLGTELDAGARARPELIDGIEVTFGVEGGVFLPGSAFAAPAGASGLSSVGAARTLISVRM